MSRKPVFVRQLDAARAAQIAVVAEILNELHFLVPEAADVDSTIIAECVIKGVDVNGVIADIEESVPHKNQPADDDFLPQCPKCGGEMAVRVVKNGPRAGSEFLGCMNYPACRGTRSLEQ